MIIKNNKEAIKVYKGQTPIAKIYKGNKLVFSAAPKFDANGHDYVDMGSAGIWATCNVGAENPWDYGLYFAWGETEGYADAAKPGGWEWTTLKYCNDSSGTRFSKYVTSSDFGTVDNKTILEPEDDAAHVNMGGDWCMPTQSDFRNLHSACNNEWFENYNNTGISGIRYTLKTDSSKVLFFPAAGYGYNTSVIYVNESGFYWASSVTAYGQRGDELYFYSTYANPGYNGYRYMGNSVRGFIQKS